jgi:hypothetical protein
MRLGPGPVRANVPPVPAEPEAVPDDVPAVDPAAAVAGWAACADDAAGGLVVAVPAGAAVVGVEGGLVVGVVVAGTVVVGAGALDTWTTANPPTPFPETWPGVVSLTNVYRGAPL